MIDHDLRSEADLATLSGEPNLNVRKATEDEIAAASAAVPDLKVLREASTLSGKLVTAQARDAAMTKLVEDGFPVPVKTGP